MDTRCFVVGLDLGKKLDYTALVVAERKGSAPATYDVGTIERFPLGTPYPDIVKYVKALLGKEPFCDLVVSQDVEVGLLGGRSRAVNQKKRKCTTLVVDATGVGAPVIDLLRAEGVYPVPVIIHGGEKVTSDNEGYSIPKWLLHSEMTVIVETGRLKVAKTLPLGKTLLEELLAWQPTQNAATGHLTFASDWREAPHDDMVFACALACWYGEETWGRRKRPGRQPNIRITEVDDRE